MLTPEQTARYIGHINLPDFGFEKQEKLLQSRALIAGAGGLGCPVGIYLAACGVGLLGVVDHDSVELSNLQRQVAYSTSDVGSSKAEKLVNAMSALNPNLKYKVYKEKLNPKNISTVLCDYDLVIDGTDNFESKFLIADACYLLKKPLLQGSVHQYHAMIMLAVPGKTPCYRCVFRRPPDVGVLEPCSEAGVLGVIAGMAGMIMATEAVKFLSGIGSSAEGTMLLYDGLNQEIRHIDTAFDEECPLCSKNATIKAIASESTLPCSTIDTAVEDGSITVTQAKKLLSAGALLVDVRERWEFEVSHLPEAISIPVSAIEHRLPDLKSSERPIVAYCQRGVRSLHSLQRLRQEGIINSYSIMGGIEAWLKETPEFMQTLNHQG